MTVVIILLIAAILGGIASLFFTDEMLNMLYYMVFDVDSLLSNQGVEFFTMLMPVTYSVGLSLIILKFLKKAFDVYVLWTDGDPDADPFLLLTNFVRAVATALIFQWVYEIFVEVCREILDKILTTISVKDDTQSWITGITSLGIVPAIAGLIFMICYLNLLFTFMARGIEIMIMRIGVPLACIGLLDNDKGVFRMYVSSFAKSFITTIVQVMLCKIGIQLMINVDIEHTHLIFWGIGCMIASISMPKILREFFIPTGGDGHIGNTVFQTVHVAQMAKNTFSSSSSASISTGAPSVPTK